MQNFLGLLKLGKFEILGLFAKAFVACLLYVNKSVNDDRRTDLTFALDNLKI